MKKILLIITLLLIPEVYYSQDVSAGLSADNSASLEASLRTNFSASGKAGLGIRFSGAYSFSKNISIVISTGYMSTYSNQRTHTIQRILDFSNNQYISTIQHESERQFQIVPLDLSLKYSFKIIGLSSYALLRGGFDFLFNYGDYNITTEKRNESTNQILESKSGNAAGILGIPNDQNKFGLGMGFGFLIPITGTINVDASYLLFLNSMYPDIHSVGIGFRYKL